MSLLSEDYNVIDCFCCWYDLLGFGSPFIEAKWDLRDTRCHKNFERISNISLSFCGSFSLGMDISLTLNDGVIKSYDLMYSKETFVIELIGYLSALSWDYESIKHEDVKMGFPGLRGVLTLGKRYSYTFINTSYDLSKGKDVSYQPKEFQMNTAFSKAYIIESEGSKIGLNGLYLFWDINVIKKVQEVISQDRDQLFCGHKLYEKLFENDTEMVFEVGDEISWLQRWFFDKNYITYTKNGMDIKIYKMISAITQIGTWLFA